MRKLICPFTEIELQIFLEFAIPKMLAGNRMSLFKQYGKDNLSAKPLTGNAAHAAADKVLSFLQSPAIGLNLPEAWSILYFGLQPRGGFEEVLK